MNEEMLPGNTCFGCGLDNPEGLRIKVYRDEAKETRVLGSFEPRGTHHGFPEILHGGLQYTALDCMAAWVFLGLRRADRVMPLTQSAQVHYKRPVPAGRPVRLSSELVSGQAVSEGRRGKRHWHIRGEILGDDDALLTAVDFSFVVVSPEVFCQMAGISALPDAFKQHFGDLTQP